MLARTKGALGPPPTPPRHPSHRGAVRLQSGSGGGGGSSSSRQCGQNLSTAALHPRPLRLRYQAACRASTRGGSGVEFLLSWFFVFAGRIIVRRGRVERLRPPPHKPPGAVRVRRLARPWGCRRCRARPRRATPGSPAEPAGGSPRERPRSAPGRPEGSPRRCW